MWIISIGVDLDCFEFVPVQIPCGKRVRHRVDGAFVFQYSARLAAIASVEVLAHRINGNFQHRACSHPVSNCPYLFDQWVG